ncbi:hypothetical protein JRQ81_001725 [Phrynocephalus forsythii]|uniref:Uncharacterized protein n=1 Tax=Phrynocephalus forsythii TaxID=171643 RepID=A0A9Q0Y7S1_9SAUR|nr:hypothetical protein JRQ81_001725 [Phrynocephalus forsythii]
MLHKNISAMMDVDGCPIQNVKRLNYAVGYQVMGYSGSDSPKRGEREEEEEEKEKEAPERRRRRKKKKTTKGGEAKQSQVGLDRVRKVPVPVRRPKGVGGDDVGNGEPMKKELEKRPATHEVETSRSGEEEDDLALTSFLSTSLAAREDPVSPPSPTPPRIPNTMVVKHRFTFCRFTCSSTHF